MRALVYEGPWMMPLREVQPPQAAPGRVIVDIRAVGICGSDVHGFMGITGRRQPPMIMGHEFCGVVSAVGPGITRFQPGDAVIGQPIMACGHCANCLAGRPNICQDRHVLGVDMPGAYAEQVSLSEAMAFAMPPNLAWETAALAEPLAVALHAANRSPIQPRDSVAIVGAGTIGLLTLLAARLRGAGTVIVSDLSPHRLALARDLGADLVIDARSQDPLAAVRATTAGHGVDVTFEAVGSSAAVQQALALVRSGGHVTWIGNSQPEVTLNMQQVVSQEVTISGTYGFHREFGQAIEALASGQVDVSPLIERQLDLEAGPEMIRALAAREVDWIKVVLHP